MTDAEKIKLLGEFREDYRTAARNSAGNNRALVFATAEFIKSVDWLLEQ
jgi:hypothetical protein